jgi:ATP/maltotriose-dependent transcriptional regulator MalT
MSLTTLVSNVNAALAQARADTMTLQQARVNQGSMAAARTQLREATALCSSALVPAAAEQAQIRLAQAQSTVDGFEQRKRSIKTDLVKAQKAERSLCKVKNALCGETTAPPARARSPTRKCSVCQGTNHNRATCPAVARSMTAYVTGPTKRKAEVLEAA